MTLQGQRGILYLRADQKVYTGGARQLFTADKGYFLIADNAEISTGDIDFTFTALIYIDTLGIQQTIISKALSSSNREYLLSVTTANRVNLTVWNGGLTIVGNVTNTTTTLVAGKWYFVSAYYDSTANTVGVSIDDGAAVTAAQTGTCADSTAGLAIGANPDAGGLEVFGGRISKVGFWKRLHTAAERTYIYNRGRGQVYGALGVAGTDGSALLTSMGAYWNLNEVAGTSTAIDYHSTNDLTPTFAELLSNTGFETVTATYGARKYDVASVRYHEGTDNATLEIGDNDAWFSAWVYHTSETADQAILGKWDDGALQEEYLLKYDQASDRFMFMVSAAGSVATTVSATTFGAPTTATWYFVMAYHDAVNDSIGISVNGGAFNTQAHLLGLFAGSAKFAVGARYSTSTVVDYADGRLTRLAVGKSPGAGIAGLATTIRDALYNSGKGVLWAGLTSTQTTDWGLVEYWNGNETSNGSALTGQHAAINLTSSGNVSVANDMGPQADFGSWSESNTLGTTINDGTGAEADAGSHGAKVIIDPLGSIGQLIQTVATVGHNYVWSVRAKVDSTSGTPQFRFRFGATNSVQTPTTSFATYTASGFAQTTNTNVTLQASTGASGANRIFYFDTASFKALELPAADGPESEIASDSVGAAHGVLTSFSSPETAWTSDKPTPIAALVNGSLTLDGSDDKIVIPDINTLDISGDITISGWLKRGADAAGSIFFKGSGAVWNYTLFYAGGTLQFYSDGLSPALFNDLTTLPTDWCHVAVVRSGTTTKLYVNGAQTATTTQTGTFGTAGTVIQIGIDNLDASIKTLGSLSDIRVYNTAKTPTEIAQLAAGTDVTSGLAGRWKLDDGPQSGVSTGDSIIRWTSLEGSSIDFIQATSANRPLYDASVINGKPGIRFNGLTSLLVKASAFLTGTEGTVIMVYRLDAVPNSYQVGLSSSDEALDTKFIQFYGRGNTVDNHIGMNQNDAGTTDFLDGSTVVNVDTNYVAVFQSNGSTITARLNGVAQTLTADIGANNGDWFSDTSARDNTVIGAVKRTTEANFFSGWICEIYVHPLNLTAASLTKYNAYSLLRYSVAA